MFRNFFLVIVLTVSFSSQSFCDSDPYPYRFEGVFEEYRYNRLKLISLLLPHNPVILEAGAHYGDDTMNFISNWPNCQILAFEPNPSAFEKLTAKTKGHNNIKLNHLGLSDKPGMARFYVCHGTGGTDPVFEGASSLLEPTAAMEIHYQGPRIDVPCVVLDQWCKENAVDHIDFMWLDMEGMELQVLRSSPKILKTVKVIYTETNLYPFRIGTTQFYELRRFLESSGFKLLSHWYQEGLQGDAIFVKTEIYNGLFTSP